MPTVVLILGSVISLTFPCRLNGAEFDQNLAAPELACNWAAAAKCNKDYYECVSAQFKGISHMAAGDSSACECANSWVSCAAVAGGGACSKTLAVVYSAFQFCSKEK
jgi:hypothetical protein